MLSQDPGAVSTAAAFVAAGGASAPVAIPVWLELVAIVAASISGALTARERKLDPVGTVCLAVACSLGGGLLRDMILQVGSVYILEQDLALPGAVITAAVVFIIPSVIERQDRIIAIFDIFAVGLFAATGADKALVYGFNPMICIMMGFFTAVGGGMLRDVFLGQTPYIFQRSNFYALAAIAGAAAYTFIAMNGISHVFAVCVCVAVTMGLRFLSLHYDIVSPTEVDLAKVDLKNVELPHVELVKAKPRRGHAGNTHSGREHAPAQRPRIDKPDRSANELASRHKRTLADIAKRRGK